MTLSYTREEKDTTGEKKKGKERTVPRAPNDRVYLVRGTNMALLPVAKTLEKRSGFLRFIWVTVITRKTVPKKGTVGHLK